MIAKRLVISGRVQGVGFRDWLEREARALAISGWVRNRADGAVEALVAGEPQAVAELCAASRRGPPMARVAAVIEEPANLPVQRGFFRRPTAWED